MHCCCCINNVILCPTLSFQDDGKSFARNFDTQRFTLLYHISLFQQRGRGSEQAILQCRQWNGAFNSNRAKGGDFTMQTIIVNDNNAQKNGIIKAPVFSYKGSCNRHMEMDMEQKSVLFLIGHTSWKKHKHLAFKVRHHHNMF